MKLRRITKWVLLALLAVVVLFVGAGVWLLSTESGARWSIAKAQDLSGNAVVIDGVSGTWASGIVLGSISYRDAETEVHVVNAQVRIDLTRALGGEIYADHLIVEEVSYRALDSGADEISEPAGAVSVPISIIVPNASLTRFVIRDETDQQIDDIRFSANWKGETIDIQSATANAFGVAVSAHGQVALTAPVALAITADWSMPLGEDEILRGQGSLNGDLDELKLQHELTSPYSVASDGSVKLSSPPNLDVLSTSETIQMDVGESIVTLNQISLQTTGWFDGYDAVWSVAIATSDLPDAVLTGSGAGTLDELHIESSTLTVGDSQIGVAGRLTWEPNLQWNTAVLIENLDPSLVATEWPGSLNGGFNFVGEWAGETPTLDFDEINIDGNVRSQPLLLQGQIRKDADQITVDSLRLDSGDNHITANGGYGQNLTMDFDIEIQDLSPFGDDLAGMLDAQGQIGGSQSEPTVDLELLASQIEFGDYAVGELAIQGRLAANESESDFAIVAESVVLGPQTIDALNVNVAGTPAGHRVNIAGDMVGVAVAAKFLGGWNDDQWQGQLLESEFELGQHGTWKQDQATALIASQEQASIEDVCWRYLEALACIGGTAGLTGLELAGHFNDIPLSTFGDYLPEGFEISGSSSAEFSAAGTIEEPVLTFSANASAIDLAFRYDPDDEPVVLSVRDLATTGSADPVNAAIDLSLSTADGGQLVFDAQVDNWQQDSAYVRANLKASLPDADFLALLTTELANISGAVETDMTVEGRLSSPNVEGHAKLENGRAEIPRAGIVLENIQILARPAGRNRIGFDLSASSGGGQVDGEGEFILSETAGWPVTATITGENFEAVRLPGLAVTVSPNLELSGTANSLHLRGEVATPRAIVEVREIPEQAVEISPDVTVYRTIELDQPARSPFLLYSDLDLVLGNEVRFIGFGLTTDLAGRLAIHTEPGRDPEGRGIVTITEGKFQAYGQELNISSGRLVFTGPLDNPTLDVEAVRHIDEVTAGVRVTGTGQEPQAEVFAEPAMSDADALSYLVIGRSVEDSNDAEDNRVRNAAAKLGLTQFMAVTSEIGTAVGLDEFGLDSDSSNAGAIMAGKQITPDLHVRYSYGLFDRIGAVLLRYRLNKSLSLEAQSGEDQSMDLIYSREKK